MYPTLLRASAPRYTVLNLTIYLIFHNFLKGKIGKIAMRPGILLLPTYTLIIKTSDLHHRLDFAQWYMVLNKRVQ